MQRIHYCYLLTRSLPEGGSMYYVGIRTCPVRKTPETDTRYMGGGPAIREAVQDERAAFTKTIVETFDTIAEAAAMERALVGLATANSPWSYNLVTGGRNKVLASDATKAKVSDAHRRLAAEDPKRREQLRAATEASKTPEALARNIVTKKRTYAAMTEEERRQRTAQLRTPEACKKRGAAWKRRLASDPDAREQLRAAQEAGHTPEALAKNSAGNAAWYANATDEQKAARVAAQQEGRRRAAIRRQVLDALASAHGLADAVAELRTAKRKRAKDPAEVEKISVGCKSWWATATDEQKAARLAGLRKASERRDAS